MKSELTCLLRCSLRTQNGCCYRIYPHAILEAVPRYTTPEIFRTPLEDIILQVLYFEEQMSSRPTEIISWLSNLIEPPQRSAIVHSAGHLVEIGAICNVAKGTFRLTPLG